MTSNLNIFIYSDYRLVLRDWFWASKGINSKLSFRYISKHLNLKAPNHFHLVISGKRNFSAPVFDKILKMMKLQPLERQYLKLLFRENTSRSNSQKAQLQKEIDLLRQAPPTAGEHGDRLKIVGHSLAWYIKMGAHFFDGKTKQEIKALVKDNCKFHISDVDVEKALEVLLAAKQLEFVEGVSRFEGGDIVTKWDFDSAEIKRHHQSNLNLALETITWPIEQRFLSGVTIPCDGELYQSIISDIRQLFVSILKRSNELAVRPENVKKVVTLHTSLFPYFKF